METEVGTENRARCREEEDVKHDRDSAKGEL